MLGTYEGADELSAYQAMLADAGYSSAADLPEGMDWEEIPDDISVTEAPALAEGDKIRAGRGEDQDTGRVVEIDGDDVTVAWSHGDSTTQPIGALADLEVL